ncbi:unnamed protein product [Rodentolepis nana]|uniref:Bifunctional lysine-specific demethylase and histidyl-hydroxylase n=1 Tax=Rodentolepis nana TaxID=102285 RepID=A0A3P7V7N6_RODNA|nr:unnamed protein product [Rodentolepis nana]
MVTTKRLYFGKDIELINGSSNFTGRAYRPKIWSEFANGATVRFLLPERYFSKFGVEMGLLQEIINGPIYSVVNFVSTSFSGSLVDFKSPNCPPGDVFIIVLENDLTVKVTSPQSTVGNGNVKIESAEMSFKMRAGDLLYLPSFYSHEVKLEEGCEHAIVLCIVNRTPVLIREWGTKLMRTMNMPQALIQTDLFRRLLECTRNSEAHFSDLYISSQFRRPSTALVKSADIGSSKTLPRKLSFSSSNTFSASSPTTKALQQQKHLLKNRTNSSGQLLQLTHAVSSDPLLSSEACDSRGTNDPIALQGHMLQRMHFRVPAVCELCKKACWHVISPPPALQCLHCQVKLHQSHIEKKDYVLRPCGKSTAILLFRAPSEEAKLSWLKSLQSAMSSIAANAGSNPTQSSSLSLCSATAAREGCAFLGFKFLRSTE